MENRWSDRNWTTLCNLLPEGWQRQAVQLGALQRKRNIESEEVLLRVLLIHLADGCSLRESSVRALQADWAKVSSVALWKRLRACSEWFRWMCQQLLRRRGVSVECPEWLTDYRVRIVDASIISEPGSTGSDWRLHYSLQLFALQCDEFRITRPQLGESFTNFEIRSGDLLMGDRAYGRERGLRYVHKQKGEFLVRLRNKALTLWTDQGKPFPLSQELQGLPEGPVGRWNLWIGNPQQEHSESIPVRLCAIRKSAEAAERSVRRALREQSKKQRSLNPETLELHRYVIVVTSLIAPAIQDNGLLELYRSRWQVELAFKRLKSILGMGHLPKTDPQGVQAWLHGKLFVALLAQAIVDEGRFFSPWGYPLGTPARQSLA